MIRWHRFLLGVLCIIVGATLGIVGSIPGAVNGATIAMYILIGIGIMLAIYSMTDTVRSDAENEEQIRRGR